MNRQVRYELTTNYKRDGFWSGWDRQNLMSMIHIKRNSFLRDSPVALQVELTLYVDDDATEQKAIVVIPATGDCYCVCIPGMMLCETFESLNAAVRCAWGTLLCE